MPEDELAEGMEQLADTWGTDAQVDLLVPSMAGDKAFRRWYAKTSRAAMSPRDAAHYFSLLYRMDVRMALPSINLPTLVMPRRDFLLPIEQSRYIAEHIPGAKFEACCRDGGMLAGRTYCAATTRWPTGL